MIRTLRLALRLLSVPALLAALLLSLSPLTPALAQGAETEHDARLADATAVLESFTSDEQSSIPTELLARAHGVAVIPKVIRGGFLLGGRRGRGVLVVKAANGEWSNPALITLTGGSIGWQFGAESADVVLVFANERSVRNIDDGKFTLGGDASAVAGPLGRRSAAALTGRAEVYAYVQSRGLFAGAAFEGARLDVDEEGSAGFYGSSGNPGAPPGAAAAEALREQNAATPASARQFLLALERAAAVPAPPSARPPAEPEEARTFPLGGGGAED